jgi:hypothetical protein
MAAALINFETMVTKQNRCPETQHLLGSSSLTVAFRRAGAQRLVGPVSSR